MAELILSGNQTFEVNSTGALCLSTESEPITLYAGQAIYINGTPLVQHFGNSVTVYGSDGATTNRPISFGYAGTNGGIVISAQITSASTDTVTACGVFGSTSNNNWGYVAPSLTPEQRAEAERQRERYMAQQARERKLQEKAEARAEKLLQQVVGKRMYEVYKQRGYFELICESGKRYRFRKQQRVQVMDGVSGEKVAYELCIIHLDYKVPPTDTLVTLLLLAMSGEDGERIMHEKGNRRAA